ncbi:Uncharacterized protein HA466_0246020 [Hirschfeldia incana]|nr:Uncharacterized protein HA466_0246020 [Hirschfeldia incana]
MVDSSNKRRKITVSEGDIATLLQRYDTNTILKLLQEMAFYSAVKMDWNELVKKTTTGITNAREYQMLWRHLSYGDPLLSVEDDAQLLDDDSDIECELEASPAVSVEASVEAIAHVKVIAASYLPRESDTLHESTSEAPLTINIPYTLPQEPSESPWLSRGMNITFPVCLQKSTPTEGINGNGSASISMASQRKTRKKWSAEEDADLIAAVKRFGEGHWAHIARGEFRGRRTASQLSQRWPHLRKRYDTSTSASQSCVQQNEAQIAVNNALSLALGNRPPSKKVAVGKQQSKPVAVQTLSRAATTVPASKSRVGVKKTTASSTSRSDLMVTANSAAAAACMGGVLPAPSVPEVESVKNASTACMPRPSGSLVVPKVEPGKTVAASKAVGPASTRPLANGNLKAVTPSPSSIKPPVTAYRSEGSTMLSASTHLDSASKIASSQRVSAASVPATVLLPPKPTAESIICKPDGGHKVQAQGDGASSLVAIQSNNMTSTNSETSKGKQAATQAQAAVLGAANQSLVDKTAVPSISGDGSKSKAKSEVIKVNNACGKPPEVATVRGTGQGV